MIISHTGKWVFVHNPKACGTSIRDALAGYHDDAASYWHQGWNTEESRVVDLAHLQAPYWTKLVPSDYVTFGFARNPYHRFSSAMNEVARRHPELTNDRASFLKMLTPANIRWDWRFIHFCPQHTFFFNGEKSVTDYVGRFEQLDLGWTAIRSLLGARIQHAVSELPHKRPSAAPRTTLTEEEVQLVNDLYARDFLMFGYTMYGSLSTDTYASRIEIIHNPSKRSVADLSSVPFTTNEAKALAAMGIQCGTSSQP